MEREIIQKPKSKEEKAMVRVRPQSLPQILPAIPDKKWIEQYKEFLGNYNEFIDSQIEGLEELADETKGSELLGLIDNYLVNLDYYYEVKEWYQSK